MSYYSRHSGQRVLGPIPFLKSSGRPMVRRNLQSMLEEAVQQQGIPIRNDHKVVSYFEDDTQAGVVLEDGRRLVADFVAACDGVHTKSWSIVTGVKHEPVSSGQAVFRTSVSADYLFAAQPSLRSAFTCVDGVPYLQWFAGPKTHATMFVTNETICWSLHHPVSFMSFSHAP